MPEDASSKSDGQCAVLPPEVPSADTGAPLIHLVGDEGSRFVLDVHSNRLFSVTPREAEVLTRWVNGNPLLSLVADYPEEVESIRQLRAQGLFCSERPQALAFGTDWEGLCHKIRHERYLTILELTQQCNLRCQYCVFGGGFQGHRTHSSVRMDATLLRAAVAAAFAHGDGLEEIALGFYGGEPLLAFDLLQAAVREARENRTGKQVVFSLTTNGTLLNPDRARFLRDAGFNIVVSIDGPREMHDRYRLFPNGRGTYAATLRGLKVLLDEFGGSGLDRISLNMVVPSTQWLPYLQDFWEGEPWVPRTLRVQTSIVNPPAGLHLPLPKLGERDSLKRQWLRSLEEPADQPTSLASGVFDFGMAKLHQRSIFRAPRRAFFPNGCCIPGHRKVLVTANGEYRICERAYGVPPIGSVRGGIDLSRVRRIIEDYTEGSRIDCLQCWAVGLCSLCFAEAYEDGRFSLPRKRGACQDVRNELEADLAMYGTIVQRYPNKENEWTAYDIS